MLALHCFLTLHSCAFSMWRWLRTSLFDTYRPELHYMRGPGPKWREKHAAALALRARSRRKQELDL
jgi:hypothetical protein